jgi:hypothetical protein
MNKLTKIGVSALCGSLASVAANAGTMEVLGGATATWSSNEGAVTGNNIGMVSGVTFKGTGELDNGTTFTLTLTGADQAGYSSGSINMEVPGLGGIKINQASGGTGIDRYDDMMPTAWEETNGTSLATGLNTVAGVGTSMNVEWNVSSDMLPDGMGLQIAVSPQADGVVVNDKAVSGDDGGDASGSGYDITVNHSALMDGLNVFAGMSTIEQAAEDAITNTTGDRTQYVLGATYAVGSVTVGYQMSRDNQQASNVGVTSYYDNQAFGVSFNVNDNLSLSYGNHKSDRSLTNASSVELEAESLQIAYTMGGMSIKVAESSVDNGSYTSGSAQDRDGTTVALSLAF